MSTANYTSLPYYRRKVIAKVRCSSHNLEIEKGRHKGQTRQRRYCLLCQERAIEDETHFLSSCQIYNRIRQTHGYATKSPQDIMNDDNQNNLSIFLSTCFRLGKDAKTKMTCVCSDKLEGIFLSFCSSKGRSYRFLEHD